MFPKHTPQNHTNLSNLNLIFLFFQDSMQNCQKRRRLSDLPNRPPSREINNPPSRKNITIHQLRVHSYQPERGIKIPLRRPQIRYPIKIRCQQKNKNQETTKRNCDQDHFFERHRYMVEFWKWKFQIQCFLQ